MLARQTELKVAAVALLVVAMLPTAKAAPGLLSYRATISTEAGEPFVAPMGGIAVEFSLFPSEFEDESQWGPVVFEAVPVEDGIFELLIDANNPIFTVEDGESTSLVEGPPLRQYLINASEVWLELTVEETTLSPRQRLVSVPFALIAADSERLGGLPAEDYATMADLAAAEGTPGPPGPQGPPGPEGPPGAAGAAAPVVWAEQGGDIYATNSGGVGIGTDTPRAELEVAGGIKVGLSTASCQDNRAGILRYEKVAKQLQFCNGDEWITVSEAGPAPNQNPSPFGNAINATFTLASQALASPVNPGGLDGADALDSDHLFYAESGFNDVSRKFRALGYDGVGWTGTAPPIDLGLFIVSSDVAVLGDDRVIRFQENSPNFVAYEWLGDQLLELGPEFDTTNNQWTRITEVASDTFAEYRPGPNEIRTIRFDGGSWQVQGTPLPEVAVYPAGDTFAGRPDMTTMKPWDGQEAIVLVAWSSNDGSPGDPTHSAMRALRWDGTTWSFLGDIQTIGGGPVAGIDEFHVVVGGSSGLRVLLLSGTEWNFGLNTGQGCNPPKTLVATSPNRLVCYSDTQVYTFDLNY